MKPLISRAKFARITESLTEEQRRDLATTVEFSDDPAGGVQVDQERIAARFAELLAEQSLADAPIPPGGRTLGARPTFTWVDETHAELVRRWEALRTQFGGPRQNGKDEAMRRFADEAEELTGQRPGTASVQRQGGQQMPPPWQDAGYSGSAMVWVAPFGTPVPQGSGSARVPYSCDQEYVDVDAIVSSLGEGAVERDRAEAARRYFLNEWKAGIYSDRVEPYRRALRDCVDQLADETDTPRHLLFDVGDD